MANKSKLTKQIGLAALIVVLYLGQQYLDSGKQQSQPQVDTRPSAGAESGAQPAPIPRGDAADDTDVIMQAFNARRSDVWVQASGTVVKTLADDNDGSRHQRFLVELSNDITILIAHNIDLAPYIPLQRGDTVEFRGEYEWNDKGGVVHWTHHDPRGRKAGGWITHRRKKYE